MDNLLYSEDAMGYNELRKEMLSRLRSFEWKEKESALLTEMIRSSEVWQNAETVLAFSPLQTEPDISPLLSDSRILLPYIDSSGMHFARAGRLHRSALGFLEPEHMEEDYGNALMLVPLIAYSGLSRLGRGGGYYDRYIAANRERLITAGVAFSVSRCPEFIPEEHDQMLDMIFSTEP